MANRWPGKRLRCAGFAGCCKVSRATAGRTSLALAIALYFDPFLEFSRAILVVPRPAYDNRQRVMKAGPRQDHLVR
jgi:hypothetical protein